MLNDATASDSILLGSISDALASLGIRHGGLREHLAGFANMNFSDLSGVFCKVSREHDTSDSLAVELANAVRLTVEGIATTVPLAHSVSLVQDSKGMLRNMSVWQYQHVGEIPGAVKQAEAGTGLLLELASKTAPASLPMVDLRGYSHKAQNRLAGRKDKLSLYTRAHTAEGFAELFCQLDDKPWVWGHGDLHLENILWTTTGPMLIDWDRTSTAPLEWELAGLIRSCMVHLPGVKTSTKVKAAHKVVTTAVASGAEINQALLKASVKARTGSALSSCIEARRSKSTIRDSVRFLDNFENWWPQIVS